MKGLIFGAVITTLLSGCVYTGINFDESKLENVKKGRPQSRGISFFSNPIDNDSRFRWQLIAHVDK